MRCTAEGIERGILMGGREGGEVNMVSERYKVVALTACVMCLCNADRVVMSVAVVPLAAKYGWSSSFLGIVQVNAKSSFLFFPICVYFEIVFGFQILTVSLDFYGFCWYIDSSSFQKERTASFLKLKRCDVL